MGLDITAYAVAPQAEGVAAQPGMKIHYWRKHHEFAAWLSALGVSRGGTAWEEPAQSIVLTSADLDRLEAVVAKGELRDWYGRDDDRRESDLAFIGKAREAIAAGFIVDIVASW